MKKWLYIFLIGMLVICLSGCGETDLDVLLDKGADTAKDGYETVKDTALDTGENIVHGINQIRYGTIPMFWYKSCLYLRKWASVIIVGSIFAGSILYEIFKKNAEIRKFALVNLCIKIPIIYTVIVYAYAIAFWFAYPQITKLPEFKNILQTGIPALWYKWAYSQLFLANTAAVVSIILGIVLYEVFRKKNPDIVRFATNTLIKKVSGIVILMVDIYPILYNVFTN